VYNKGAKRSRDGYNPHDLLATAYRAKMDYDSAIKIYQAAIEESPLSDGLWNKKLGDTYLAKGEYEKAIDAFKKANEREPTDSWA
jgi:tetratricopeptide (TPR) repeat protein